MIQKHRPFGALPLSILAVAMLAIIPLAPASGMMSLSVCGADGVTRTINVPLDREGDDRDDCVKACHGFCSRKQMPQEGDDLDE